ncbi:MAG: YdcH family protein [Proteobacteria bacterium]|nr:YdcH family protein [Pseudomonadota bacterium]
MVYTEVEATIESLKVQHAQLEAALREEESHIWKNMIRIEQLKKEKLRKKDEMLRRSLQAN